MGFPYSWVNTRCANNGRTYTIPIYRGITLSCTMYGKPFYYLLGNVDILFIYKISNILNKISYIYQISYILY